MYTQRAVFEASSIIAIPFLHTNMVALWNSNEWKVLTSNKASPKEHFNTRMDLDQGRQRL